MEELSRQMQMQRPCGLRSQTQHQGDREQFSMTGAQGAAEELEREERPDQGGPHAKDLAPVKHSGKFMLEALRKIYWRE